MKEMRVRNGPILYQVDSFAGRAFEGNPAAVCLLDSPADERWMQSVATEMNLSETAFLYPEDETYHLRWFTPAVEVDLCGHATLASAHALWEEGTLGEGETVHFETRSGRLSASRSGGWIEMDFPSDPIEEARPPEGLAEATCAQALWYGRGTNYDFMVVEDEAAVRAVRPDFSRLRELVPSGLTVTSRSADDRFDFVSRFFAPAFGVDEDPVTGSAHCSLAPYWAERLGVDRLVGFQASERGGIVRTTVQGDRVLLAGQATTVFRGHLSITAAPVE